MQGLIITEHFPGPNTSSNTGLVQLGVGTCWLRGSETKSLSFCQQEWAETLTQHFLLSFHLFLLLIIASLSITHSVSHFISPLTLILLPFITLSCFISVHLILCHHSPSASSLITLSVFFLLLSPLFFYSDVHKFLLPFLCTALRFLQTPSWAYIHKFFFLITILNNSTTLEVAVFTEVCSIIDLKDQRHNL